MPRWWCIKCQAERDHEYDYCHSACGNNCVHRCKTCKLETLANVSEPSLGDSSKDMVKQAVAQARSCSSSTTGNSKESNLRSNRDWYVDWECCYWHLSMSNINVWYTY